jgi:hypothetical protein
MTLKRRSVSQYVWHVEEPSLLKAINAKHRSKFADDTCATFSASYMVLTFHVPTVVVVLVDIRVGTEASFRLWPQHIIHPAKAGPSSPRTGVSWVVVDVSVACGFLWGGVANPSPNPLLYLGLGMAVGTKSLQAELVYFLYIKTFLFCDLPFLSLQ